MGLHNMLMPFPFAPHHADSRLKGSLTMEPAIASALQEDYD